MLHFFFYDDNIQGLVSLARFGGLDSFLGEIPAAAMASLSCLGRSASAKSVYQKGRTPLDTAHTKHRCAHHDRGRRNQYLLYQVELYSLMLLGKFKMKGFQDKKHMLSISLTKSIALIMLKGLHTRVESTTFLPGLFDHRFMRLVISDYDQARAKESCHYKDPKSTGESNLGNVGTSAALRYG